MNYCQSHKDKVLNNYHNVLKHNLEWKNKRNIYYKKWYMDNKHIIAEKRNKTRELKKKKINKEKIIFKIINEQTIINWDY